MYTLVIYRSEANLKFAEQTKNPQRVTVSWGDDESYSYGVDWARTYKDDIVMVVETDKPERCVAS